MRRENKSCLKGIMTSEAAGRSSMVGQKKKWGDTKHDLKTLRWKKEDSGDRNKKWRRRVRVAETPGLNGGRIRSFTAEGYHTIQLSWLWDSAQQDVHN